MLMHSFTDAFTLSPYWKMEHEAIYNTESIPVPIKSVIPGGCASAKQFLRDINHRKTRQPLPTTALSMRTALLGGIPGGDSRGSLFGSFSREEGFAYLLQPEQRFHDEPDKRNNQQLLRNQSCGQDALYFMGQKEVNNFEVYCHMSSPSWISPEQKDDASSLPRSSLSSWGSIIQTPSLQKRNFKDSASQTIDLLLPNDNGYNGSRASRPNGLGLSQTSISGDMVNRRSCSSHCPCVCHEPQNVLPHSPANHNKHQRPGVIMVPVNSNRTNSSLVTHIPLQVETDTHVSKISVQQVAENIVSEGDSDSDKEDNCFRSVMDETKARFNLTKTDWEKIPIRKFPSGGRLLGGEWTKIFHSKLKQSNPWCSLRFKNNHVRSENSRKSHSAPFFRGAGECKRPECGLKLQFVIQEEKGKYVDIKYIGNVCHKIRE